MRSVRVDRPFLPKFSSARRLQRSGSRAALLALAGILLAGCPEEGATDAGADAGTPTDAAGTDRASADRATADLTGVDLTGVDLAATDAAEVIPECPPGEITGGTCRCGGEPYFDGFCCLDQHQAEECVEGTPLTACGLLDEPGTTYTLQNDVESDGHCFVIKGDDITLDLNGHTVTWRSPDTAEWYYAVLCHPSWSDLPPDWQGGGDRFRVTNGSIVQGSSGDACLSGATDTGTATHAIYLRSCDGCEVDHLDITVACHDTTPIWVRGGDSPEVHHNVIHNNVMTVGNRHYPGESSIWINGVSGHGRVYDNEIHGGPHVGIRCSGDSAEMIEVYNNHIAHHERYVNGYALAAGASNLEIYANHIEPVAGRGIHITGDHIVFRDNVMIIKEEPVIDQYGGVDEPGTWLPAHGVKIEGGHDHQIFGNYVEGVQPSDQYGPPSPLNLNSSESQGDIDIHDNTFVARTALGTATGDTGYGSFAVYAPAIQTLDCGAGGGGGNPSYLLRNNLFQSNDRLLYVERVTCGGLHFEGNTFERLDNPTSNSHAFVLHGTSAALSFSNNSFVGFDPADIDVGGSADVDLAMIVQATVAVTDGGGAPLSGAEVTWTGAEGTPVVGSTTDDSGTLSLELPTVTYRTGSSPPLTDPNPYTLLVTLDGYAPHEESVTAIAEAVVEVVLTLQ